MRAAQVMGFVVAAEVLLAAASHAANPAFQAYFFTVCATATGALAERCAETPDGLGDLSGDSESSLVPSQNLSHSQSPLGLAQARGKEQRERDEGLHGERAEPSTAKLDIGPFSVLAHANMNAFDREVRSDLERAFDGDSRALELGFDYRASARTVLGLIAGFSKTAYDFDAGPTGVGFTPPRTAGGSRTDSLYMSGFAALSLGETGFVDVAVGFERSDRTLRRNAVFQESTRTITQVNVQTEGDTDATTTWASVNGGFDFGRSAFSAGLYAGATYAKSELDAYAERDLNGSGLAMSFGASSSTSLRGHAGVRGAYTFNTTHGVVVPQLRVEYTREFDDDVARMAARFVLDPGASVFEARGAERDVSALQAGCGISAILVNGWQPFLNVDVTLGNEPLDRTRVTLGVRVEL